MRALFAAAVAGECALLAWAGRYAEFAAPGNALRFVPLILAAGACFLLAVARFPGARPAVWFWSIAVLLRVLALPMAPGDDFWRYIWESRVQHAGHNPYALAPDSPELAPLRDAAWPRINHPESPAIYPPLASLTFSALTRVSASPLLFKCAFAAADLLTAALLLSLVGGAARHRAVAWYAWNPAIVYAFAGAAHFDSLMLLALTAAVWSFSRHALLSAACLGLAIAFKLVPIFLLPAWAFALRSRVWMLAPAVLIPAALTYCFGGPGVVLPPLLAFARVTRFNDLVWGFLEAATLPNPTGQNWPYTFALLVVIAVLSWKLRDDFPRSVLWCLGAALILSPVLHPWYATWILPLAIWRGQHAWTVLSLSALSAFLLWETTPLWTAWQPNVLTRALVAVPPLVALRFLRTEGGAHRVTACPPRTPR